MRAAGDPETWGPNWVYIGRGDRRKGLPPSVWGNPFKVGDVGREEAVASYRRKLKSDSHLMARLSELRGSVLVCHCEKDELCHGDVILELLGREEVEAGEDANVDDGNEGPKHRVGDGPRGKGPPLHTWKKGLPRELADGGGLCSPGKWPIARRPEALEEKAVRIRAVFQKGVAALGDAAARRALVFQLAAGKVKKSPFAAELIEDLRRICSRPSFSWGTR